MLGGTYRLLEPISRGGMGEVYLAAHERLPMQVAVKLLNPALFGTAGFAQFGREAAILAKLRHPNVVQLVDFNWTESGIPFLVMEHLPGTDLADLLARQPRFSPAEVCAILQPIASALYAAHRVGIAHLDLKPSNIMVVPVEGRANLIKVIDFGIAKARRVPREESGDEVLGTPEFMSPEQADGRPEEVGAASDQFSVSVLAYLMLTGELPFQGADADAVLEAVASCRPRPIPAWTGDGRAPASVTSVLLRGMAKQPADRYPSTLAFVRALRQALAIDGLLPERRAASVATLVPELAATTTPPAPPRQRTSGGDARIPGKRRLLRLSLGAALAAGLAVPVFPWSAGSTTETWKTLRAYASQAAEVCRTEGKLLLEQMHRLGGDGS